MKCSVLWLFCGSIVAFAAYMLAMLYIQKVPESVGSNFTFFFLFPLLFLAFGVIVVFLTQYSNCDKRRLFSLKQ